MTNRHAIKTPLDLAAFWPYQVVVLGDLISRQTHQLLKEHSELNLSQWRVLAAVGDTPGRSAAEVVTVTPMDKGIVSRAVTFLLHHGYLRRVPSPDDKRRAALFLTKKGETEFLDLSDKQRQVIASLKSETLSDRAFTQALTERIAKMRDSKKP